MNTNIENSVEKSVNTVMNTLGLSESMFSPSRLITAAVLLILCLIIIKVVMRIVDRFLDKSSVEKSLHVFIRSSFKYTMLFVMILLIAASLGINITSLIAVFSVMGLAISLAVQGTLSNLAGGIMILVSKPFKVGDYVAAGDAEGQVKEIGLVHTQVLSLDNRLIFIPNGDISAARITNYTCEGIRRAELVITASYDAPIDTVHNAFADAIASVPDILKEPKPFVNVSNYLESSIEYTVRVWATAEDYWTVYYGLMEAVKRSFDKFDVEMTYNHLNVHVMNN